MVVQRTFDLTDLSPAELAELFCEMDAVDQAEFFSAIHAVAATWPGAGWCQQSCSIAGHIGDKGREVIIKLAEHVLDCENLELVIAERETPAS